MPSRRQAISSSRTATVATAVVLIGLVGVVVGTPTREGLPAQYRAAMERLLTQGPEVGRWRIEDAWGVRVRAIAPWPADPGRLLVGRVDGPSPGVAPQDPIKAQAGHVRTYRRERLVTYVSDAPRRLFFRNYRPTGPAVPVTADGGAAALLVEWVPRYGFGGETCRRVWHDRRTFEVIQVEDRSYHGRLLHGLYRLSTDPGAMAAPESAAEPRFGEGRGPWKPRPVTDAPFTVLAPAYVPPGFDLTISGYHEWPLPGRPGAGARSPAPSRPEPRKLRFAMFTYSDGLAFLAVNVAPSQDMDALQAFAQKRDEHRARADACPSLPGVAGDVREGALLIRRRADLCRTVLRVDDVQGSSVAVMGQNEIPGDEYIRVIRSLVPQGEPPTPER